MKIVLALFVLLFTISCTYDDGIDRRVFDYEIGMEAFHSGKYKKAAIYLKKACDNDRDAACCANLAVLYEEGKSVKQDYKKAIEFYKKACDIGGYFGCNNLGYLYKNGMGVEQNKTKAREYYFKACDNGEESSCKFYEILKNEGY